MKKGYRWFVVAMLWSVCVFNYADRQAFSSIFPSLKTEFGFDPVQLGLIGSAFAWMYAAAAPLAGFVGDRVSRKFLILGGCLAWSSTTVLTSLCGRIWQFGAVRAMTGLGEAFYMPAALSMLSDYHDRRSRSLAFSLHQSGVYIGTIAGSWGGALFAEREGWRTGFYFFGAVGVVLVLMLFGGLKEPVRTGEAAEGGAPGPKLAAAPGAAETLRLIFSRPAAVLLMAVFVGANFVATIFLIWTPTFLVEKFHFRLTEAGLFGSAFINVASAISVPLGGWMADRLARRFGGGRAFVQAAGLLGGAAFIVIVGLTSSRTVLLAAMALFGACKGLYDSNIFSSLYDVIEPRARASAAGVMNTVGWTGGAFGPVAVGFATKYGRYGSDALANMGEAIACGGLIYLLAGAVILVAAFQLRRPSAPLATAGEAAPV